MITLVKQVKKAFSEIHSSSVFGLFDDDQVAVLRQKTQWVNGNAEAVESEIP